MNPEKLLRIIESNIGKLSAEAIYIIDGDFNVWAHRGEIKGEIIGYYRKFPLATMNIGSLVCNKKSFLLKITERTGVIVVMKEEHHTMMAAANLRSRINALSEFYELDKAIEILEKEKKS